MKSIKILAIILVTTLTSCTEKQRSRSFGGQFEVKLPKGQKLIEATWKGKDLWYLTRQRREGEPIERYLFKEESSFGVMEGSVIFKEL
ncbi:hypothetical protein [Tenacibaculum sp. C7A-26P2]|uniref:hypothetical protein n=1 Tax=Tenacibaculum sp. C7A-26P2 TaxID=3447504 RepID=UPI003F855F70